ncbi:hypothetical protein NDU88_002918 [Pleurodeles waltl]|uniref:Uncharacterized protein n=1 Tax=Pleurodeles waltl TaxID=8319 RepID=A0AAV7UCH8_PLEWA|nr:hypothetical protein NDU88_002918 [Pleurodeles waltl]
MVKRHLAKGTPTEVATEDGHQGQTEGVTNLEEYTVAILTAIKDTKTSLEVQIAAVAGEVGFRPGHGYSLGACGQSSRVEMEERWTKARTHCRNNKRKNNKASPTKEQMKAAQEKVVLELKQNNDILGNNRWRSLAPEEGVTSSGSEDTETDHSSEDDTFPKVPPMTWIAESSQGLEVPALGDSHPGTQPWEKGDAD